MSERICWICKRTEREVEDAIFDSSPRDASYIDDVAVGLDEDGHSLIPNVTMFNVLTPYALCHVCNSLIYSVIIDNGCIDEEMINDIIDAKINELVDKFIQAINKG